MSSVNTTSLHLLVFLYSFLSLSFFRLRLEGQIFSLSGYLSSPFSQIYLFFFPHAVADGVKGGQLFQGQDGVRVVEAGLVSLDGGHPVAGGEEILQQRRYFCVILNCGDLI